MQDEVDLKLPHLPPWKGQASLGDLPQLAPHFLDGRLPKIRKRPQEWFMKFHLWVKCLNLKWLLEPPLFLN